MRVVIHGPPGSGKTHLCFLLLKAFHPVMYVNGDASADDAMDNYLAQSPLTILSIVDDYQFFDDWPDVPVTRRVAVLCGTPHEDAALLEAACYGADVVLRFPDRSKKKKDAPAGLFPNPIVEKNRYGNVGVIELVEVPNLLRKAFIYSIGLGDVL